MSDIVDRANDEADAWTAEKIRQALNPPLRTTVLTFGKGGLLTAITECVDCGEDIGEKRKQAMPSAVRCFGCQTAREGKK